MRGKKRINTGTTENILGISLGHWMALQQFVRSGRNSTGDQPLLHGVPDQLRSRLDTEQIHDPVLVIFHILR